MDGDEPTQATQNVLDPRRVGKQNSGFSDEDVSDIICVLYPHSDSARQEIQRLSKEHSPHIIGKHEADGVELDYDLEDHASRFESHPTSHGDHAIILRLSSQVKNPAAGFAFGRNGARCDVVFLNDPLRRVSNIHFRIYVNEYGNVMVEDQSTNGTFVDGKLLTCHPKNKTSSQSTNKWVLSSGNLIRIFLHSEIRDLTFRVRIPRRDDDYERAYLAKVGEYFVRHGLHPSGGGHTPKPDTNAGTVDIFKVPGGPLTKRVGFEASPSPHPSPSKRKESQSGLSSEWKGSGKYNRISMIGKGAFAVVYKVTSKYDGLPYAAKELEKRRFVKNGVLDQKVENEMKIMQRVQHPNIVRYIENFDWEDRLLIIIMEFIPCGDLGRTISDDGPFTVEMTQTMSKQLLGALGYLHANNITHRDVKPDNILIQSMEPLVVKLTDFGLSKMVDTAETFLRTFCGTLLYCAPEVYTEYAEYDDNGVRIRGKRMRRVPGQRYNHAVDIWSLGGVLFYSLSGSPPYPVKSGISYSELLHKIMTTSLDTMPLQNHGIDEAGTDFIQRMIQRRPEYRATIPELESHPWLGGLGSIIQASQSYDEITDDEEYTSQPQPTMYADDRVSDSMSDISDKENSSIAQDNHQQRLFGEVGVSAIGSSGAIPVDFLNLPADHSMGATEILDSHVDEAYNSADSETIQGRNHRAYHHNTTSILPNQSADQLQSLVENVASQSLGGSDPAIQGLPASQHLSYSMDPNSSKRKPPSNDTSEEFDENTPPGKPIIKRLKSQGNLEEVTEEVLREFKLLARVPQVMRLESGRQIDYPVNKVEWWEPDQNTWHLQYPEMTQLQHDAFRQAAKDGGEMFWPGKTALWDLAVKYFSPSPGPDYKDVRRTNSPARGLRRDDSKMVEDTAMEYPSTAPPIESSSMPDTCPPDTKIVVPVGDSMSTNRMVALVDTSASSCVKGISFPITDALVTFGRGSENTEVFEDWQDSRVPKFAFKIMLWKDGYDPSKNAAKGEGDQPWCKAASEEDSTYHFWLCSKATLGIKINGYNLPSSDSKNPSSPSQYWTKVYDGDLLMIWGGQDPRNKTELAFRCWWGGSSKSRSRNKQQLELATPQVAAKLNAACQKTEKRIKYTIERRRRAKEAKAEIDWRRTQVERERERSRVFEQKRQEAVAFLAARQASASRRGSPASAPATTNASVTQTAPYFSRQSPDKAAFRMGR